MDNANNHQTALAREEALVVRHLPDEVLVYDLKEDEAHCLNKTAAFVWNHCDGRTTVAEMSKLLEREVGSPVGEEVIWYALDQLGKVHLLKEQVTQPVKPGLSRRQLLRRLGKGALVALPMIMSLTAPTAVQAGASVVVTNNRISNGQCPTTGPACRDQCCTNQGADGNRHICRDSTGGQNCLGAPCVSTTSANCPGA